MQGQPYQNLNDPVAIANRAFTPLDATIKGVENPELEQLESVQNLKRSGVSDSDVKMMCSHQGAGPFAIDGAPDINLIEQNNVNPRSVLKPEWEHPRYVAACEKCESVKRTIRENLERFQVSLQALLSTLNDREAVVDWRARVLNALRSFPDGATVSTLSDASRLRCSLLYPALKSLVFDGLVVSCKLTKRGRSFTGYRIADVSAGSAS